MFELIFLKILLQISLFLLQTLPKCYINILYRVKNLVKMIFKPPSPKKLLFLIWPNPKKFQICNGDIHEIWLTLLCETMTYFQLSLLYFLRQHIEVLKKFLNLFQLILDFFLIKVTKKGGQQYKRRKKFTDIFGVFSLISHFWDL